MGELFLYHYPFHHADKRNMILVYTTSNTKQRDGLISLETASNIDDEKDIKTENRLLFMH